MGIKLLNKLRNIMKYKKIKSIYLLLFVLLLIITSFNLTYSKQLNVGILIYEGVYLLDFAGPLEVFNDVMINDSTPAFNVYLISPDGKSVKAHTSTEIQPQYSILNSMQPDILVIPGGNLRLAEDQKISQWIKNTYEKSQITMSVCTGAFILADIGLLNGKEVTTWYGAKARLQKQYPEIRVVDKRYTDNGKIITTAGISAGIDGSFYVVEKLFGIEIANKTKKYIEWE